MSNILQQCKGAGIWFCDIKNGFALLKNNSILKWCDLGVEDSDSAIETR